MHLGELGRTHHRREQHVGAGFGVELEARDAVLEVAVHPEGIRARDDQEVRVAARGHRGADALRSFLLRVKFLRSVGVLARAGVVLDVDRGHAGRLEGGNGVIETFRVRDDRDAHRIGDGLRLRG